MTSKEPVRDEERGRPEGDKGRKFFEMGTSSNSRSFELESWSYVPTKNYSLQMMQKVEPTVTENAIPATFHEILAFFRVYTSTVGSSQLIALVVFDFNRFLWNCVFNLIIKSLPLNYIIFFLSSYVPHEHMYINKMAPLMYGYNVMMILSILTNFSIAIESILIVLYYALESVFHGAPWARCRQDAFFDKKFKINVTCVSIEKICDIALTYRAQFPLSFPYLVLNHPNDTSDVFTAPPLIFYYNAAEKIYWDVSKKVQIEIAVTISIILVVIALSRKQIYRRMIWQVMYYCNYILIVIYLGALFHIFIFSLETKLVEKKVILHTASGKSAQYLDYEMLSDTLGSPPVLHFLASKSNHQTNPAEDSATLVLSNSLNYLMKGVVLYMLKRYTEHSYKVSFLRVTYTNISFIYWPIYLSLIPLGSIIGCIFFFLQGVTEFLSFVIAYNIAWECVQDAFPKLKWWLMIIITLPYVMLFRIKMLRPGFFRRTVSYALAKGCIALAEMVIIIWLYPIARLEDDIAFHTGAPPAKLISIAIRFIPVYFGVKLYLIISTQYDMVAFSRNIEAVNFLLRLTYLLTGVLIIGILYPVIKNLVIEKLNWRSLFRPAPQWGPKDHVQRQLRKQFDSREYIASTASRYLSRYLKSKLTSRMYRLEVCYETDKGQRRSNIAPQFDTFRYYDETKKDM